MPTVRHPRDRDDVAGHPPAGVTVRGASYSVARDGDHATVEVPDEQHAEALAAAYGVDPVDIATDTEPEGVAEAIEAGECPWCDEYDGDHVGQHASSAHPDKWDAYSEDD